MDSRLEVSSQHKEHVKEIKALCHALFDNLDETCDRRDFQDPSIMIESMDEPVQIFLVV